MKRTGTAKRQNHGNKAIKGGYGGGRRSKIIG
jgi:hypothetical protein